MNKNTIIKLIAVLAMCFLIGGALVACKGAAGPAGPQGPQGEKGEKGETGAAGSTPTIEIKDGYWYVNGENLGVKATPDSADCTHNWNYIDVIQHQKVVAEDGTVSYVDGVYVKACADCGFAAIGTGVQHAWVDAPVEATCTSPKWVGESCSVCGEKGEGNYVGEKAPHNWTKEQPVTDNNNLTAPKYICVDGGMLVKHCKDCGLTEQRSVKADEYGHTVKNWVYPANDTLGEDVQGVATGTCLVCHNSNITYKLPFLSSDEYKVEVKEAATCAKDGKTQYTYVDADNNINFVYVDTVEAVGHILNGKPLSDYETLNNDGSYKYSNEAATAVANSVNIYPYWIGAMDKDGKYINHLNVNLFSGDKFVCDRVTECHFICEECDGTLKVNVYYGHNGASAYGTEPTCIAGGTLKVACQNAGCDYDSLNNVTGTSAPKDQPIAVPALKHAMLYTVEEKTVTIGSKSYEVAYLAGVCKGNNTDACTHTEDYKVDGNVYYMYEYKSNDVKAANCLEYGKTQYTSKYVVYNNNGDMVAISDAIKTIQVDIPKAPYHKLNGVYLENDNAIAIGTKGVYELKEQGTTVSVWDTAACETVLPGAGYFVCEYCSTIEGANAMVKVDVVKNHKAINVEKGSDSTCSTKGTYTYACGYTTCGAVDLDGFYDLVDHKLAYEFITLTVDNTATGEDYEAYASYLPAGAEKYYIIIEYCEFADCTEYTAAKVVAKSATEFEKEDSMCKAPTCYEDGYDMYKYIDNGAIQYVKNFVGKVAHTVDGLKIDSDEFKDKWMTSVAYPGAINVKAPGAGVFSENDLVCGGASNDGYLECEVCAAAGVPAMINNVQVFQEHVFGSIKKDATCEENGINICGNEACKKEYEVKAIGHDYKYAFEVEGDKITLTATCQRNDCKYGLDEKAKVVTYDLSIVNDALSSNVNSTSTVVSKATCDKGAVTKYTVKIVATPSADNKALTFAVVPVADKETKATFTIDFELTSGPKPHSYAKANLLIVTEDVVVNESTGEEATIYYFILVCDDCDSYCTLYTLNAEAYAEFEEQVKSDADEYADFLEYCVALANSFQGIII